MVDEERVRAQLLVQRSETTARIESLTGDFAAIVDAASGVATDDEHDPEGATIAFERAAVQALLDQARDHLAQVDRALARVADGSYGRCEGCGEAIAAARLEARPVATTCIACAARSR